VLHTAVLAKHDHLTAFYLHATDCAPGEFPCHGSGLRREQTMQTTSSGHVLLAPTTPVSTTTLITRKRLITRNARSARSDFGIGDSSATGA